jgi:glycosyltransferase 2 family protein
VKKVFFQILRIGVPVIFGLYLAWYFWSTMSDTDKEKVSGVFARANYFYVFLSLVFCWLSHVSRAIRWRYMLEPMGYKTRLSTSYHSVIVAYFMNLLLPRAGEISRAGVMMRYENVPFEKGFGSILAERVVDVIMLAIITVLTLWLQGDKYPEIMDKFNQLKAEYTGAKSDSNLGLYIWITLGVIVAVCIFFYFKNEKFRNKVKSIGKGMADGLLTILRLKKRWQFLAHTVFIWLMYLALYWVCFFAIPETSDIDYKGMMLGFLAGGLSIIIVQGGIGVYPVFVATAISFYVAEGDYPLLYALGWLAWISQMGLIVVAGVISLFLLPKLKPATE